LPSIDWDDLRYVLAIARAHAIGPAARLLRVNATTVTRRLSRVEAALGSTLFERKDGRLRPTEAAAKVIERAERVEAEVATIAERVSGVDAAASGHVRVTSIPLIINRLLLPRIDRIRDRHPALVLELNADRRNLSVMRRDADIALRLARPEREQRAMTRRLTHLQYAVYAPSTGNASRLPWITYEEGMALLPHVAWIERAIRQEGGRPALIVNDSDVALQAIKQGHGKSLLPCLVADREPGLKRVSSATPVLERELWLLVNRSLRHLARIEAVVEWIEDLFAAASNFDERR